jgi:hypothetical protein
MYELSIMLQMNIFQLKMRAGGVRQRTKVRKDPSKSPPVSQLSPDQQAAFSQPIDPGTVNEDDSMTSLTGPSEGDDLEDTTQKSGGDDGDIVVPQDEGIK